MPSDILKIIDEHSGGMKFSELLVILLEERGRKSTPYDTLAYLAANYLDEILAEIEKEPKLEIHRYVMDLGAGHSREKLFICRSSL